MACYRSQIPLCFKRPYDEEARGFFGDCAAPGSTEERIAVHAFVQGLERRMAPHVSELQRATEPPPGFRKHWRWLTTARPLPAGFQSTVGP